MAKLPTVDIPQPCPEPWDRMAADGPNRRFCGRCQEHVHDLSAMTTDEAEAFLQRAGRAPACVSVPTSWTAAFKAAAAVGAGLLAGCDDPPAPIEPTPLVATPPPPPPPPPHHEPIPDAGTMDRPSQWNTTAHSYTRGRITTIQVIKGTSNEDVRKGPAAP